MRIECPGCKLTGNIDDATVPATGLAMTCPRCKKQFTAEKPAFNAGGPVAMLDTCPSCQYATFSDEKFAVCPKCGLVVAEYHKKLMEKRKVEAQRQTAPPQVRRQEPPPARITEEQRSRDEESRKKYGLDQVAPGANVAESARSAHKAEPQPVVIIRWGSIVVALLLMIYGGTGIHEYLNKVKEAEAAIAAFEVAPSSQQIILQFLLFPVLSILYAVYIIVIALLFMEVHRWNSTAMEIGAWIGVGLFTFMKGTDIYFWCRRASSDASFSYYALGLASDIFLACLWIAPFIFLADYFRSMKI